MPPRRSVRNKLAVRNKKKRKEADTADHDGSPPKKKVYKYYCNAENCTNRAYVGGVCVKHGATVKRCSVEGCTNQAVNGGVCIRHGATCTKKRCNKDGCGNQAQIGGVCFRHGATPKLCRFPGCTNYPQGRGGLCKRHGATRKLCRFPNCTNQVRKGGVCRRHKSYISPPPPQGNNNMLCGVIEDGGNQRNASEIVEISDNVERGDDWNEPPMAKRATTLTKTIRTVSTSNNVRGNPSSSSSSTQTSRAFTKRKAATITSNTHRSINKGNDFSNTNTTKRRYRRNSKSSGDDTAAAAAAKTLLSFASGYTTIGSTEDMSTYYDDDNNASFHIDNDQMEAQRAAVNHSNATLEVIPAILWDDSPISSFPSISKFLTFDEVKNVRLVSKTLHLHIQVKRARLRVKPNGVNRLFLERARRFLGPAKELFNRSQVELVGNAIKSCRRFLGNVNTGKEQGFFQYTNCLSNVKRLILSRPDDYTILHSLGDMPSLEYLSFRGCFPFYLSRPCRMYLRSSYQSQDYDLKNAAYIELTKCSLPRLLLKDLARSATNLKKLKVRRCRPENDGDGDCDEFFDASYSDEFFEGLASLRGLEDFKFVPSYLLSPCITVPNDDQIAPDGYVFVNRDDDGGGGELDEFSFLSNRMLDCVCKTQSTSLKSLSMRNVELRDGVGIEPLRRLEVIEKICLCALESFEGSHLQLICDVGKECLQKLSLANCRHIEGHLRHLVDLNRLEELSLLVCSLCDDDIESLSNMKGLKILNVNGELKHDCDLSQLRLNARNLRHLSLQINRKVSPDVANNLNKMTSLESLCLKARFFGVHEMFDFDEDEDDQEDAPLSCFPVDEESTLNFSVGTRRSMKMDDSVMGETIMSDDDDVQEDALFEESPLDFSALYNLRSLLIHDSLLTDDLVESISGLPKMQELSLWDCQDLSGESINHISNMQSLEKLSLHRFDAISEASLEILSTLDSIKELEFYQCGIMSDVEISTSLGLMKNLKKLTISPYRLEKPAHLTHLQLVKDDSDQIAKKRVGNLRRKICNRGLF